MRRSVIHAHETSYADPIRVSNGDALSLSGREELWEGHRWLWAVAEDGREGWAWRRRPTGDPGWIPESVLDS